MAEPKKRSRRGPAPSPEGPKATLAALKGSKEFGVWLEELAAFQRLPLSILIEHALITYAEQIGFPKKPPER